MLLLASMPRAQGLLAYPTWLDRHRPTAAASAAEKRLEIVPPGVIFQTTLFERSET